MFIIAKLLTTSDNRYKKYLSSLALHVQLVTFLQCTPVFLLYKSHNLILSQVNAIIEISTPKQIIVMPDLTSLQSPHTDKKKHEISFHKELYHMNIVGITVK